MRMTGKVNLMSLGLFVIMMTPGIGYFVEGSITFSSCLSSVLAFFLLVYELFLRADLA